MAGRAVIVGAIVAATLLWWKPFSMPNWASVAFVLALFLMAGVVTVKRMRAESRLARTLWETLTRK